MVTKEDFVVCISAAGYVKKHSLKVMAANENEYPTVKEGDYIEGFYKVNNLDTILLFTNLGNYLFLPVREISESKFKDVGTHVSSIIKVSDGERIVKTIAVHQFDDSIITAFTKDGMVKRMPINVLEVSRYTKPISMFKLKENDELINVSRFDGKEAIVITNDGYGLKYNVSEIPVVGIRTSGVKAIKLNPFAQVVNGFVVNPEKEYITLFTDKNTAKRIKLTDIDKTSRAKKGSVVLKSPKTKKYDIIKAYPTSSKSIFGVIDGDIGYIKSSDINIMDIASTGTTYTKKNVDNVFQVSKIIDITNEKDMPKKEVVEIIEEPEEKPKKEKQLTMSDFFEEFKL